MKRIRITIDEELLAKIDTMVTQLATTRSAFIRDALREALRRFDIEQMEARHAAGYARIPPDPGEFAPWGAEQVWPEE